MRPATRSFTLERAATANLRRLGRLVEFATLRPWDRVSEDVVAYVVIEAQNTWGNFVRAYYLSLWLGVRLRSGTRVTTNPRFVAKTMDDAVGWAINRYRLPKNRRKPNPAGQFDPRDEPAWFKLDTLLDLAGDLQCSNLAQVTAAVSGSPTVFQQLPTFRNFFAHRNRHTLATASSAAASLGLPTVGGPAAALTYRPTTRPASTIAEWLQDIEVAIAGACA